MIGNPVPAPLAIGRPISGATAGSILYAGDGGVLAQDNTNFKWGTTAGQGLTLNAGTATTDVNALNALQEWNNNSISFTGYNFSIKNTASAAGALHSRWRGGAEGLTDLVVIDKSGNVGLGTTSPAQTLDVTGNIQASGQIFTGNGSRLAPGFIFPNAAIGTGLWANSSSLGITFGQNTEIRIGTGTAGFTLRAVGVAGWGVGNEGVVNDTGLSRLSSGVIAVGTGSQGSTAGTLIAGNVGIGTTSPTAKLHLPAATAAADTASLKIPSGVVATTPVAGNIEADDLHIYWTRADGTRLQLDN